MQKGMGVEDGPLSVATFPQEWEYKVIWVDLPQLQRMIDENAGTIPGFEYYGADGWEAYAVTAVDMKLNVRYHIWLKRPLIGPEVSVNLEREGERHAGSPD